MQALGCVHLEQLVETDEESRIPLAVRHLVAQLDNVRAVFAELVDRNAHVVLKVVVNAEKDDELSACDEQSFVCQAKVAVEARLLHSTLVDELEQAERGETKLP